MGQRVVSATMFYPRGGSAFVARALAHGLVDVGVELTLVAGSRHDHGRFEDAREFYRGLMLHEVDFTPALRSGGDPLAFRGPAGTAPLQPSFEDRPGVADRAFFHLGNDRYELQVDAWAEALEDAGAAEADVLHLHHLTPIHEAARRVAPDVPVVTQLHGTELLMLENLLGGPAAGGPHAAAWARRLRRWAAGSAQLVVAPGNRHRAARLLGVDPARLSPLANGFDPRLFEPREVDRAAVWREALVEAPRGWRPGGEPGSVAYAAEDVERLVGGPILLYVGRFTEVKRLPLLLEAFAAARARTGAGSLVIVGGHPGEWEGEHPIETIERLGLRDVHLAGWHEHGELPDLLNAADALVLPSAREAFGQVLVEAMACGVPTIAANALGPTSIVTDGQTGWLFGVDDTGQLAAVLAEAIADRDERVRRAAIARADALDRFTWPALARRLETILRAATGERDGEGVGSDPCAETSPTPT
jgi:glycosyltransferase involved in cell wall biosynthesis